MYKINHCKCIKNYFDASLKNTFSIIFIVFYQFHEVIAHIAIFKRKDKVLNLFTVLRIKN